MYSKGILLKAKIYIVLVSKFEKTTTLNKQQATRESALDIYVKER